MRLTSIALSATIFATSISARADAIYTYTGQELTTTFAGITKTAAGITGTITLANALAPNTTYILISPLDFSFDTSVDGTFDLANIIGRRGRYKFQNISTDNLGNIALYNILIATEKDNAILEKEGPGLREYDSLSIYPQPWSWASAGPGSFSTTATSPTPEPASFALLGTGLLCMTTLVRKRWTS